MSFFRPNIDSKGRAIRGIGAVCLAVAAALVWSHSVVAGVALALAAAFVAYEAVRGWCVLRACGIKTKF